VKTKVNNGGMQEGVDYMYQQLPLFEATDSCHVQEFVHVVDLFNEREDNSERRRISSG